MKEIGEAEVCPYCGYQEDALQKSPYLPVRTWLMDRYYIGKIKTVDGEGVTYLGWDNILQSAVLIREFLPEGLCGRVGDGVTVRPLAESAVDYSRCLLDFLEQSRALARMRELSALFPTYDIFELGGTAYSVSEYTESITLDEFLHRNGNSLTFEQVRSLMLPAVSTLSALHSADIIHGGISPETLYVGKDGRLRFYGFAGKELRTVRGALKPTLYPGYSAIEQYGFDGKIGAHTDVYSFAATLYRVLSGATPAEAKERMNLDTVVPSLHLEGKVPEYAAKALACAMNLMPDERTATMERFRAEFSAAPSVKVKEDEFDLIEDISSDKEEEAPQKGTNKAIVYTLVAMLATLLVLFGIFYFVDSKWQLFGVFDGKEEKSETVSLLVIPSEATPSVNTGSTLTRQIPDFVGQTLAACEQNFGSYNFKVEYKRYDEEYAKGMIVSQEPKAGTEIPLDGEDAPTITVAISLGSAKVQLPPVVGLTYAEALETLWQAGLSYENISCNIENPEYDGVITKMTPSAGSSCSIYDADIVLYVENPVESVVSVPEVSEENREVASIDDSSAVTSVASKPRQ
jgi:serine/threonine-protein kinase